MSSRVRGAGVRQAADIPLLAERYLAYFSRLNRRQITEFTTQAAYVLARHRWPGNSLELRNVVERAMLLAEGETLGAVDFASTSTRSVHLDERVALPASGIDLEQLERSLVVQALERTGWNQTRAAALLGLNRDQIRYRIEKFQLEKSSAP